MLINLTKLSINQIQSALRKGELSSVDLVEAVFSNIEEYNPLINAYISYSYKNAIEDAEKAQAEISQGNYKGLLHGIPIGVKDLIHLKGTPTTTGSRIHLNFKPEYNAEIVDNLKRNGAIIIGKENMHSLAYGSTGDVSNFGPAKNPLNTDMITGGSSSGSAAAVASHMSFGSIGSDTGGSIRIPAAMCGVVGMKPTFGLVSRKGTVSLSSTLDTLGPITRTVEDNSILLDALINNRYKNNSVTTYSDVNIKKKIGIPQNFFFDLIDKEIHDTFLDTVNGLEKNGFEVIPIEIPHMEEFNAAHSVIFATEVYESMKEKLIDKPEKIEEEIRTRLLEGLFVQGHDYIRMNRVRDYAIETLHRVLKDVDVLLTPTVGSYPSKIGERFVKVNGKKVHIRGVYSKLVKLANLTGFPAMTIPIGKSKAGFANSIQIIGAPFQEKVLYNYASEVEQI